MKFTQTLLVVTVGAALSFTAVHGAQAADSQDQIAHGHEVFVKWCAPCHAPVADKKELMAGTNTLEMRYKGSKPAALEQRSDLTPEVVSLFVRRGLNWMPWFRTTEISDADLAALGAYLSQKNPSLKKNRK